MTHRVEQIFLRPAMGIMAGDARRRSRFEALVGLVETRRILVVTVGTELGDRCHGQLGMVGAMSTVAGGAVLGSRRVRGAIPPELGDLAVTAETQGRLSLVQVAIVWGTVTVVAGIALQLDYRLMLDFELFHRRSGLRMTRQAETAGLILDQFPLAGAMGGMAGETFAFGKRRMSGVRRHFAGQFFVTTETKLAISGISVKETGTLTSVGFMAGRALPAGEGPVQAEQTHFRTGLLVAGEADGGFSLLEQVADC